MIFFMFFCSLLTGLFGVECLIIMTVWSLFFFMLNFSCFEGLEFGFYSDLFSMGMGYLSSLVLLLILFSMYFSNESKKFMLYYVSNVIVLCFFFTDNFMWFFVSFELTIIPLFLSVLGWGSQPERLKAVKFMVVYTLLFSSPMLLGLIFLMDKLSFNLFVWGHYFFYFSLNGNSILLMLTLVSFFVKIPLYFFHSWLPRAHVEAPLEGSILLAGVMLKLGLYGLIRMLSILQLGVSLQNFLISISLLGSIISMIMAVSSDDLKISVALSSVGHMNFCLSSIFSGKEWALYGVFLTMISHGLSSPLLFFSVTEVYKISHSRSVLINKGLGSKFPSFQLFNLLFWSLNSSLPPSISFLGEIFCIGGLLNYTLISMCFICVYVISCSMFSMFVFSHQSHGGKPGLKYCGPYFNVSFFLISLFTVVLIVLMFFSVDLFL